MIRMYSDSIEFEVVGARVFCSSCLRCGAMLLIDLRDSFDPFKAHDAFHDSIATLPKRGRK